MDIPKGYCVVPFVEAFSGSSGGFRNCCMAFPQQRSDHTQSFQDWWYGNTMQNFRSKFHAGSLPDDCRGCAENEHLQGHSFRNSVNRDVGKVIHEPTWPSRWHLTFGNLCNLACWTCSEHASSLIETQKKQLMMIPETFDSQARHRDTWQKLKHDVLDSYEHHHGLITLTLQGGEPFFNNELLEFLEFLITQGLASRTRLDFHTNGTHFNRRISAMLRSGTWAYVCVFVSVDAVGKKAEWLRYGSRWNRIEQNIKGIMTCADFVELHLTLSVMNLKDLPQTQSWASSHDLPLRINVLKSPSFMSIDQWDLSPESLIDPDILCGSGFTQYFKRLGQDPIPGSAKMLADYIKSFDSLRKPLRNFDRDLSDTLGL